jgi:hypothetical protein
VKLIQTDQYFDFDRYQNTDSLVYFVLNLEALSIQPRGLATANTAAIKIVFFIVKGGMKVYVCLN